VVNGHVLIHGPTVRLEREISRAKRPLAPRRMAQAGCI
jgi:hypothetical protein